MNRKHFPLLLFVIALAFVGYRSESAGSGNACLASVFPVAPAKVQPIANRVANSKTAPAWELKNLDGKAVRLSDFKGKVVLLNFWATWCGPCREEIPDLVALQNQYKDQGLAVVGVSVDTIDAAQVKTFAQRMKINYPVVMGDNDLIDAYGNLEGIPTTFYIDRAGNLAGRHLGSADKATFEKAVKPLLEKTTTNL